eukprot:jgi/Chrpa1/5315/Chrysochromulina_OHIO_Genome00014573-RA
MSETPPPPEENQLPALPASTDALKSETHRLEVDGAAATLDELGPVVVTEAGQLRYISNWVGMTKDEQEATQRIIAKRNAQRLARLRGGGAVQTTSVGTHVYGGFECSFRRKPAAPGYEGRPPLMLIHPLGIGLASWFWDNYVDEWTGAELFVPDLIGCGASEVWDPASRGLHVPLDWERQIQSLWREHVRRPMVVVSQGGIAPLAVTLASRQTDLWQGKRAVRAVVLISPPELSALADGLGEAEVTRNFQLLSITLGRPFLYRALSSRFFIDFFSRQFLFAPAEGASKDESKEQLFTRFIDACCEETAFQGHHLAPWTISHRSVYNNVYKIGAATIPLILSALWLLPPTGAAFVATMFYSQLLAQEFHRWTHTPPPLLAPWQRQLQQVGIALPLKEHIAHHKPPFDKHYCILTGGLNAVLDSRPVLFWRRLEALVYRANGQEPNSWKDPRVKELALSL